MQRSAILTVISIAIILLISIGVIGVQRTLFPFNSSTFSASDYSVSIESGNQTTNAANETNYVNSTSTIPETVTQTNHLTTTVIKGTSTALVTSYTVNDLKREFDAHDSRLHDCN